MFYNNVVIVVYVQQMTHGGVKFSMAPVCLSRAHLLAFSTDSSTCSDGTVGLESSDGLVCCTAGCGSCGGLGCSTLYLPDYNASDCCVINIENSGVMCEDSGTAPCILEGKHLYPSHGIAVYSSQLSMVGSPCVLLIFYEYVRK